MYSKQDAAKIKQDFWTSFGQYMRPVIGASGETVNWMNFKTGIRYLYFRMDVNSKQASIAIELRHPDIGQRDQHYNTLLSLRSILEEHTKETWSWQNEASDEDGRPIGRIGTVLPGVNIFNKQDWPAIISFLKPRIIALDAFWYMAREQFN